MITWSHFIAFATAALLLWGVGAWAAWKKKSALVYGATIAGIVVFMAFIVGLWTSLERPPLRTMGETRLWYSFFLPVVGVITSSRWKYRWLPGFSFVLALVFIAINIFKPEIHNKTMMPALQSPWFAPHVIIYMFAYAVMGAAALVAAYQLWRAHKGKAVDSFNVLDDLVGLGLAFITTGMLFGALWAKEAWGHYWAWDPKETWAAITWMAYLVYVHTRRVSPSSVKAPLVMLIVSFALLQMCWWGINYLPAAQGASVHTYST